MLDKTVSYGKIIVYNFTTRCQVISIALNCFIINHRIYLAKNMAGKMRYIIYGAGGIGSIMGGHLARTEHDVILIGRPGHVNFINNNGLHLITPTGTHVLRIPAVTSPSQIDFATGDVILLCMKGQDTELALRDLKRVTEDIPVFCFQNGVRNEEIAIRYFSCVYGVMLRVGAVYLTDGSVIARRDPPGWYVIGRYPKGTDELIEAVAEELRIAGYFVRTTTDVMPYL